MPTVCTAKRLQQKESEEETMNEIRIDDRYSILSAMITARLDSIVRRINAYDAIAAKTGKAPRMVLENIKADITDAQKAIENLASDLIDDLDYWHEDAATIADWLKEHS